MFFNLLFSSFCLCYSLSEIIVLCVKCLQKFSPPLLSLLCDPELLISRWELIFDINFGAPKLNKDTVIVAFGHVLSVIGVYTKVLNLVREQNTITELEFVLDVCFF